MTAVKERELYGGARLIRAPSHIRLGRALARIGVAAGATEITPRGAEMMVGLEAIVLSPYWDSAKPPHLSQGIGHTAAAGPPDPATQWGRHWTIGEAISQFERDLARYVAGVRRAFTRPLTPWQFDAAVDFNYHTGAIEVANWVKLFNAGHSVDAEQSLTANWRSQPSRTEAERRLFFHAQYSGDGTALLLRADSHGKLDWSTAKRIDVRGYFPRVRP